MNRARKEKTEIILDEEVAKIIKNIARKEGKTFSCIVEDAVLKYNHPETVKIAIQKMAVKRFCSKPFNQNNDNIKGLLNEDLYGI